MVKQNPKINGKKGLSKILWGEKWKEVKKCFSFSYQRQQSMEPNMEYSEGHQAWNLPLATKLWSSL
jgi:hypothetical protein